MEYTIIQPSLKFFFIASDIWLCRGLLWEVELVLKVMMLQLGILLFAVSCSSEFGTDSTTNTRGRITPPDTSTETNGLNEGDEDSPNSGGETQYETFQPNVQITSTSSNPTNNGLIDVTVTFSESVSEFTEADLKVTGGIISGFTGTGSTYNFNLTPTGVGNLTVNIEPGVAKDSMNLAR